jgi:iron complex transport system ATP-binding protein
MRMDGVSRASNGRVLLDDISLVVQRGQFAGIIGPNGAGKSTLLRTMAGLLAPSEGAVLLDGASLDTYRRRQVAQQIACVPQQSVVGEFGFLSKDVVLMGRYPHLEPWQSGTASDRDIVTKAMVDTETLPFAQRTITELSGGERQRVTLARALAQTPKVLLLDEPTASLDLYHQLQVLNLIRQLVDQEGMAAVAALHDLSLASRYCDRLLLMQQGRIVADGTPAEVLTPEHLARVYGVMARVEPHSETGGMLIHVLDIVPERHAQQRD